MLPSFLICGGQRCGTTSMYRALAEHPAIVKAVLHKGVHYFDIGYGARRALVSRPLPDARDRQPAQRAARWRAGADVRVEPVLHVPPARGRADRPRSARREADRADPRSGRAGLLAARPRVRPRLRDRGRFRAARWRSETAPAQGRELASDRRSRPPTRSRTSTTPTGPAASTSATSGRSPTCSDPGPHPRRRQRRVLRLAGDRLRPCHRLPRAAERGHARARTRYPAFEQHNARKRALPIPEHVRAELTAHYEPFDAELGEWLGRPVSWRVSSSA